MINTDVIIDLNYMDDSRSDVNADRVMGGCNSTKECGVEDESGGYDWSRCPVHREQF